MIIFDYFIECFSMTELGLDTLRSKGLMMDDTDKWECQFCTYQNFQVSTKCTLCNKRRQDSRVSDFENEEQDIYKMAASMGHNKESSMVSSTSTQICGTSADPVIGTKWACSSCTYLNWQKSSKCTQCLRPRKNVSPGSRSPKERSKKELTEAQTRDISRSGRTTPARDVTPGSPKAAKCTSNNDINKTLTKYAKIKWTCKACTYENWPKTQKCVMCGTCRGRFSPEIITSPPSLSPTDITPKQMGSTSPTLACGGGSPQSDNQEIEVQDPSTSGAIISEDNKATEKRLKQIRKCIREKDWLWLNACVGVVVGDHGAIESFIASGGDPSRQLTQDEVALLNRPSAFEVGYTLVHLAIRFKRDDMLAVLLTSTESNANGLKRLPSHVCPDVAAEIRREISSILRQRKGGKGEFPCQFFSDCVTFALPSGIVFTCTSLQIFL